MGVVDGRIWPTFEVFYIQSMLFNCSSAHSSIEYVADVLGSLPNPITRDDIANLDFHAILNELQNVVLQAGSLSRYFWPVRKEHEERGALLRKALRVDETNPLHSRDLRNAIEHFDERLDKYLLSGMVGVIIPEYVGPTPSESQVEGHFFRAFFMDRGVFRLLGEEYEIQPIADEISRLGSILAEADSNGGRFLSG